MLAALSVALSAQAAYVLEDGTGFAGSKYLPSAGHPYGADSVRGPMYLAEFNNLPPATINNPNAPVGGICIDQQRGTVYSCDGFTVQRESHPEYNPPVLTTSVGLGVYFPSNTITGMAIDSERQRLWCCDDKFILSFDVSQPGFPPVGFPNPGPDWLYWLDPTDYICGLGWESSATVLVPPGVGVPTPAVAGAGHLWACATNGEIYRFDVNGDPVGPQPLSVVNAIGTLGGLAVNTTNGGGPTGAPWNTNGSVPAPPCSFQQAGYHIIVSDGQNIYDAFSNAYGPLAVGNGNGSILGLAYSSDGQLLPGTSPCPLNGATAGAPGTGGNMPAIATSQAQTHINPLTVDLTLGPVNNVCMLLVDLCPISGGTGAPFGGLPLPTGDTMHIWPLSGSYIGITGLTTNGFGVQQFTLPAPTVMVMQAGVQFSFQYYFLDAANPTLYGCFTDGMTLIWGLH